MSVIQQNFHRTNSCRMKFFFIEPQRTQLRLCAMNELKNGYQCRLTTEMSQLIILLEDYTHFNEHFEELFVQVYNLKH